MDGEKRETGRQHVVSPRLLGCGCLASYRSCDFCDVASFLVKGSSWQADTFSFRSHLPLKSGLLKGKGEKNVRLSIVRAFHQRGGRRQVANAQPEEDIVDTSGLALVADLGLVSSLLWLLSMGKYSHGLEYLPN